MIIIIRALSLIKKEKKERTKKGKAKEKKRKKERPKKEKNKNKKGAMLLSFSTLVLQSSTVFFIYRVSYVVTFIY